MPQVVFDPKSRTFKIENEHIRGQTAKLENLTLLKTTTYVRLNSIITEDATTE